MDLGQRPKEIPILYLQSSTAESFMSNVNEMKLSYRGKQLDRIIGGFLEIPTANGFVPFFTDKVYWDVRVNGNRMILEKKSFNKELIFSDRQELLFEGGKIVERKIFEEGTHTRVYSYQYIGDLLKGEYSYVDEQLRSQKTFYFNSAKNLDSLVVSYPNSAFKSVQIFRDYDTKPNKIKGFMVLEEFLPRALSTNNYRRKTTISVSVIGERSFFDEKSWDEKLFN
ncbi:hypothetical protein HS960_22700 [Sphingobacterium paramultivorum]|uniref:Uncharacterized protein n=1 Tax=Sphingobacterium paramultivorum TaxID=2886510 RepID=A0A7G5E8G5_9SPHI|nr:MULTISPECIES: hypothetical protein [Sphingobacterium]MCS4166485.1 hypothetical protein [Sphingobacterium sp. BIGb0116]QMV70290.1 hypothetical protein HS960_22700 [Sphingobacterium paramultivorum]WSO14139.1 hypothetical protein VUL84_22710 [Sphingobacterium paramultivorum]